MTTIYSCYKDNQSDIRPLTIEVEITNGIGIHLVGMADMEVKSTLLRTITAMQACGYYVPGKKVVINVAPAQEYPCNIDLPVALGILIESGQAGGFNPFKKTLVYGELAPSGAILAPYNGEISPISLRKWAQNQGFEHIITHNSDEATTYRNCGMLGFDMLYRVIETINWDARL